MLELVQVLILLEHPLRHPAGGLAGIAYWALVFPLDTLKTRIQTDSPHKPAYSGMLDCARKVVRAEGLAGLFKGWQPCFARAVPANAALFLCYEIVHSRLSASFAAGNDDPLENV